MPAYHTKNLKGKWKEANIHYLVYNIGLQNSITFTAKYKWQKT
jgi:hypothetical protein